MPPSCGVCLQNPSKYKCPKCRIPYCSVECCKKHKESPCVAPASEQGPRAPSLPVSRPKRNFEEDEADEDAIRLTRRSLTAVALDRNVRSCLRDTNLQKKIADIDSSEDVEGAIERAMQEPDFRAFCDQVLSKVAL
ncbi:hypothetical protein CYMTET_33544 [Cymbomonas tetramitiformis]|uniref:HIT-type domain-containing protein n=1 Tax=Cymbomonas tetramitiformis TaxID=36881 RepID=A0AAE0FCU5_9CHLO|nr:hypothetical protein CYMTET_33544 [Cymbomonas tetramitiformis]